jgi:hypothetical protein
MSFDVDKLVSLLPAIYRIRDVETAAQLEGLLDPEEQVELQLLRSSSSLTAREQRRLNELEEKRQRGPLKSLLSVIAEQAEVLEENLDQLYDDLFIETCAEWAVPYIGDLIGARGVFVFPGAKFTQRAFVANTLAYRRRKGTAAVLEQLARDITGWTGKVVEYFQLLATTQYMNHLRPENVSFTSLRHRHFAGLQERLPAENLSEADKRQWKALEYINTPFETLTRTADVRRIEPRRGRYNIPNIGIFLYRIGSFPVTEAPAFQLDSHRWLFDALGRDVQLYNRPEPEDEITHLAEPTNVPIPISRRVLDHYLDQYYGPDKSIFLKSVDIDAIDACNLSDVAGGSWAYQPPPGRVAIDPVLGRIAFGDPQTQPPLVTFNYGFSAEMGGGEYGRAKTFSESSTVINVGKNETITTIGDGLNELATLLNADPKLEGGVVEIVDNDHYVELLNINVPAGKKVEIRAAGKRRPVLLIAGQALISGGENAELTLNGLVVARGALLVSQAVDNELGALRLRHCTLAPTAQLAEASPPQIATPRLIVEERNVVVEIDHCIVGAIRAIDGARLHITDSIIDATDETAVAYSGLSESEPGAAIKVEDTTVIGKVHTQIMDLASNTIFLSELKSADSWVAPVITERLQEGCVRFSYVPPGSRLPRLHRCQPVSLGEAARVRPVFTSLRHGDAGYCQLSQHCALEIRRGADDGAELGAFHDLYQPQRETNLRTSLDEYLRFGLEAGIFFAS